MNDEEIKSIEAVKKGEDAEKALKFLDESVSEIKTRFQEALFESKFSDTKGREECYMMIRAIDSITDQIKHYIKTGKQAQSKLDKMKSKVKKLVNF